jgi:predicted DNA binding protein
MWVLKFQMSRKLSIFEPVAKKYNLTIIGYPVTSFKKNNKYYFVGAGTLSGNEKDIKKCLEMVKKNKRVKKIERKKDFFIVLYERDELLKELYNSEFIKIKPIIIDNQGKETWEIGCFDKKPLMKLISFLKKRLSNFKLLKLKQEFLDTLAILNIIPDITSKQKNALQLAVDNGYYAYPKKVELKALAKLMNISYSTYQAHLKKAEGKLIPFMSKNL